MKSRLGPRTTDPRRRLAAQAHHLAARLLRSSLTGQRARSLRCSAPTHDLAHLDANSLAPGRWSWAGMALVLLAGATLLAGPARAPIARAAASRPAPAATLPVGPAQLAPVPIPTPKPLAVDWLAQHPQPDLDVHADSAILVDTDTMEVLWARDEHSSRPPASLTKLLTAMVAADLATSLDQQVTVPVEATQVESDSTMMGLLPGEQLTVRELLYGVFLVSGNDAAETLARTLASRDRFIQLMNAKAAALGMADSHFTSPAGLDDPALRTTAYDLAIAAATIVNRYPQLVAIAGSKMQALPASATHQAYYLGSLIRLVSTYPGATGLKTGYTDDAGYCLVATAARGDRHLAAVVLHSDLALTADATHLLDYGFGLPRPLPLDLSQFPQV